METYNTIDAFNQCYFHHHSMMTATSHDRFTMSLSNGCIFNRNEYGDDIGIPKNMSWIRKKDIPLEGTYVYFTRDDAYLEVTDTYYHEDIFFILMHADVHDDVNIQITLHDFIKHANDYRLCTDEEEEQLKLRRTPGKYDDLDMFINPHTGIAKPWGHIKTVTNAKEGILLCYKENREDL